MSAENGKDWYRNMLDNPLWQKMKAEIHIRDKHKCRCCNDEKTNLEVHHTEYKGFPWDAPKDKLVLICRHCHRTIEKFKLPWGSGLKAKKMTSPTFTYVIICHEDGVAIGKYKDNEAEKVIEIDNDTISGVIQDKMNLWLEHGETDFLIDDEIGKD